jgi:HAD superfamily hydrolase (TIGR01484 family)
MRYHALACDYDGTIAKDGHVDVDTLEALQHLRASGRKLLLVTGRELEHLEAVFPEMGIFDRIVAENGAVVFTPATRELRLMAGRPDERFISALRAENIKPLSIGHVIVATWQPNETAVMRLIRDLGLELQIIFNKGAVMILPSGINKAAGLIAALRDLKLSPHNVAGIGDAENDHAFLAICECTAVTANAVPMLKEKADFVCSASHGAGVRELIQQMLESDLSVVEDRLKRHNTVIGTMNGSELTVPVYGSNVLVAGTSDGGKTTFATSFLERLAEQKYQFCIVDPEGDYNDLQKTIVFGNTKQPPALEEAISVLEDPEQNVVLNLLGVPLEDRPAESGRILFQLQELRGETGHPHWIVLDETHHLLPREWTSSGAALPRKVSGVLMITVHPDRLSPEALSPIDIIVVTGESISKTVKTLSEKLQLKTPLLPKQNLKSGEALFWRIRPMQDPSVFRTILPERQQKRHIRKYAEGKLAPEGSFYFRGPDGKLNLRAQNLMMFLQIAEGVDDQTWLYHLRHGDYSRWFAEHIKDMDLAEEAKRVEQDRSLSAKKSRELIRNSVEQRYTAPAGLQDDG